MICSYVSVQHSKVALRIVCIAFILLLAACTADSDPNPLVEDTRLQACIDEANTVGIENIRSLHCEGSASENGALKLAGLEQLPALAELIVENADLQSLSSSVAGQLESLKVSNSDLDQFPISSYTSLRSITLIDNQYHEIDFSDVHGLEVITVNQEHADAVWVTLPEQPSLNKLGLLNVAIDSIVLSSSDTIKSLVLKEIQGIQNFVNSNSEYWLNIVIETNNLPCSAYEYFHSLHDKALVLDIPSNEALSCGAYAQFENDSLARCVDDTYLDLQEITELNCQFSGELTELDLLPNLQSLTITGSVTDVELSENSNLRQLTLNTPQLTEVDLSNNELSQLSLNLAQDASVLYPNSDALTRLELKSSNVDFTQFTNLEYLSIYDSVAQVIDVNSLVNLKELYINAENLTELKMANNSELTKIDIRDAAISAFDASHLTQLTSARFHAPQLTDINLANTQVTKFDVVHVATLQHISLENTPIEVLYLGFSEALETLNIDGMASLHQLVIGNNQLAGLDFTTLAGIRQLSIGNSPMLQSLIFPSNAIVNEVTILSTPLANIDFSYLPELSSLSLGSKVNINRTSTASMGETLKLESLNLAANTKLQQVYLGPNQLESLDLSDLPMLASLRIASSQLHSLYLPSLSPLTNLELGENALSELELAEFDQLKYLSVRIPNISYLNLTKRSSDSFLERVSLYDVNGEVVLPTQGLRSLNIYNCGIDSVFNNTSVSSGVGILQLDSCESLPLSTPFINNVSYLEFRNVAVPDLSALSNNQAGIVVMENIDNEVIDLSGFSSLIAFDIDDDIVGCHNPGSIIFSEASNISCPTEQ